MKNRQNISMDNAQRNPNVLLEEEGEGRGREGEGREREEKEKKE